MKTTQEYQKRLQRHLDELKWLYCELYPGREDMFTQLCEQMEAWYQERPESEKKLDREREQEPAADLMHPQYRIKADVFIHKSHKGFPLCVLHK